MIHKKLVKILIVFGTRPEAIKMAPLIKAFQEYNLFFDTKVCVTAQHREMLDQVLDFFKIVPDYDLNVMKKGQDLYHVTSNVLLSMKPVLEDYHPDLVIVHGDTSTTFAVSLAAYYQKINIAHLEAGLRTGNKYSPWPEEANRQLTTQLATYHFAPTIRSKQNLLKENINEENIEVTGNSVIDALSFTLDKIKESSQLEKQIVSSINQLITGVAFNLKESKYILVTGHRRENYGLGLTNICKALKILADNNPKVQIIYPVHYNPNVIKTVNEQLMGINNIHLIPPLRYEQFVYLMYHAYFIITDSGGIQEEAPSLGVPVLVMRDTTERPEALHWGTVKLVGTNVEEITKQSQMLLDDDILYNQMSQPHNPFGNGKACEKVVKYTQIKLTSN